jgi:hypothetical protein
MEIRNINGYLVSHYIFEGSDFVFAHSGSMESMQSGRCSGKERESARCNETIGIQTNVANVYFVNGLWTTPATLPSLFSPCR